MVLTIRIGSVQSTNNRLVIDFCQHLPSCSPHPQSAITYGESDTDYDFLRTFCSALQSQRDPGCDALSLIIEIQKCRTNRETDAIPKLNACSFLRSSDEDTRQVKPRHKT